LARGLQNRGDMYTQSQPLPSASIEHDLRRFEPCVKPFLPGLRGSALRLTRNAQDAEDLLQEALLRAFRFWSRYQHGSNLRAWLHRILINTFVNEYRRKRREREVMQTLQHEVGSAEHHDSETEAAGEVLSDELQVSLAGLPPEFRAVLWAVAVDELSYRETADALGCPVGTVMSRLHRARRLVQKTLRAAAPATAQVREFAAVAAVRAA
jgi:RNA polymerase sigma-70 factor, ECF subfamily